MSRQGIARALIFVTLAHLIGAGSSQAADPVFTVAPGTNAAALAQNIVGSGVTIVGAPVLKGMAGQAGSFDNFSTGPFRNPVTNATGTVTIPRGVILSSGHVQDATGNYAGGASRSMGGPGDPALTTIAGFPTQDAVSLEFSFVPDSAEVFIEYLFASTEYPGYVNSNFNDVFAFFVNGTNVALVPGTNDPVTVNKINAGRPVGSGVSNAQYFTQYSTFNTPFNYGGSTVLLTARAAVNKGVVNTFRFAVADASDTVLDAAVFIGQGRFTTTNPQTLSVSTSQLPPAQRGVFYSAQLNADGGTPPYTWSLGPGALPNAQGPAVSAASGATKSMTAATKSTSAAKESWAVAPSALPTGFTLSSSGLLQGTPSQAGTFTFDVTVTDSTGATATRTLTLLVSGNLPGDGPVITTLALPAGQALAPYSYQLTASGGTAPFTWSIAAGSLPPGLALTSGGLLIGSTGQDHSVSFDIRVTDVAGRSAVRTFALTIAPRSTVGTNVPEIATTALPQATVGRIYGMMLAGRNGSEPYTWSISGLPEGLQGNARGEIIGTPTRAGTFNVQVTLVDGAGVRSVNTFSFTVQPAVITLTTERLGEGRIGETFSSGLGAVGGIPPYTFSVSSGALPPGLSLTSSGAVAGTPSQLGEFSFTIQAVDSTGGRGSRSYGVRIRPPALFLTSQTLGTGVLGAAFTLTVTAVGGAPPYRWSATGLPDGLSLNPDTGVLSGTPSRTGRFEVAVRVSDQDQEFSARSYSMDVITQVLITSTLGYVITGSQVSIGMAATGGRAPLNWSVLSGNLPDGLTLSSAGLISGTPTTLGESSVTIQARDADGVTGSRAYSVRTVDPLVATPQAPPPAPFGSSYSFSLTATGGIGPYTWSVLSGDLPSGITFDPSGAISGSSSTPGTFTFVAQAADSATPRQMTQRSVTIQVVLPDVSGVTITLPSNPQPSQQLSVSLSIASPYPVNVSGNLVLSFAPNTANNADDPMIGFTTGGRTAPFTIAAGQTQAVFSRSDLALQTGTTAGTITLTPSLQAGGGPINCNCQLNQTVVIPRSAPTITAVRATRTATGFSVVVTGFSTTREGTQGVFRFSGSNALDTTELTVPLTSTFTTFFQAAASAQTGGQFTLTIPFTIQGNTSAVNSVSVTLTNTAGTSQAVTATF